MLDPRVFFEEHAPAKLAGRIVAALPSDVVMIFHIQGPGGGTWQVLRGEEDVQIGPASDGPKDCQVWCSADDFMGIVSGTLSGRNAFLSGRLRVVGDVGLALRLQGILVA